MRNRSANGVTSAAVLATLCVAGGIAHADTYSWAGTTGNFSTATRWTGGVAPTGLSATDTLVFGKTASYTATNNQYAAATERQFFLTNMLFNDTAALTVAATARTGTGSVSPGNLPITPPFRFVVPNGLIDQQGAGAATLTAPISVGHGGSLTIQAEAGSGQLMLANPATTTSLADGYQFQGEGTLNFNNLSSNPILVGNMANFTGPVNVLAGTVSVADSTATPVISGGFGTGGGDVISNQTVVTVAAGATFNFNGNAETFGAIAGAGTIALGGTGGLTFDYGASDLTFAGNITQAPGGLGSVVTKDLGSGHTTYTWQGNAQHTGTTTINAGAMVLSGAGQLSATKAIVISNNSSLILDNTATNLNDRLNPLATMILNGALTINGGPGTTTTEALVGMTIGGNPGEASVNVNNGSAGGTASLTAGTLAVSTAIGGYVNFTGSGSVFVTTAPNLVNGIIGPASVNYADWATIDPANGNKIIALPAGSYQTSADPTTWLSTDNVKVTGALIGNADATTGTVNSLVLAANTTVNIGTSLTLTTGGILAANSATISGGQINSATSNGQLTATVAAGNTLTINSNLVDGPVTNTLVKTGPGTLVLGGSNALNGGVVVQNGTVSVTSDANLGTSGNITLNGGTLQVTGSSFISARNVLINGLDGTIDTGANNVTFSGNFGSNGTTASAGTLTKLGTGTLTINLYQSTGNLNILQGTVASGIGNTFTGSTMIMVAAGATLDLSYDTDGEALGMISGAGNVNLLATGGINVGSANFGDVTFSGAMDTYSNGVPATGGGASFTKSGVGSMTLSGPSNFDGLVAIQDGTIVVMADVLPGVNGPLGNQPAGPTGVITIGVKPASGSGEADLVAPAALMIGQAGVTVGRDIATAGTNGANGTAMGSITIGTTYASGTSTFSGAINLIRSLEVNVAGTGSTSLTGVVSGAGDLIKLGSGSAVLTNSGNSFTGGLYVESGTVTLTAAGAGSTASYNVSGGTLVAPAGLTGPLAMTSLFVSNQGTLDLNDNDVVLNYTGASPLASVKAAIANARDGGAWDHAGITSTSAKNGGGITTLAVAEASTLGVTSFDGVAVDTTTLIVKYTYYGDVNMDGRVNGDDYALADRALAKGGLAGTAQWTDGDVNYDGIVNAQDFLLIDKSMALQGGIVLDPAFLAMRESEFGSGYVSALVASVPEPTSLVLLAAGSLGLFGRRRRS
ncbi:MAG TPA: autotransporter-associated beta strand repeat-containing protein [Tepidisphaeraceae bacterium]|nr:autotransporter-associated beta strand repeat-containing protein [Tepidisphaeraceae bacterium]